MTSWESVGTRRLVLKVMPSSELLIGGHWVMGHPRHGWKVGHRALEEAWCKKLGNVLKVRRLDCRSCMRVGRRI